MKITLILCIREIFTILKVRKPVYFEIRLTAAIKHISFHYLYQPVSLMGSAIDNMKSQMGPWFAITKILNNFH